MIFFDAHCDILYTIDTPEKLFSNHHHWDAKRALQNGPFIQVFSLFEGSGNPEQTKHAMESQLQKAVKAEKMRPEMLKLIRTRADLEESLNQGPKTRVYGLIEAEGAEILGGSRSLSELDRLYEMGLRVLTLSWNYDNDVCDSVAGNNIHNGLSEFGRQVVKRAKELGVVIDVSHASDKTFEDAVCCGGPITASHSNARALCGHRRNLTDEQIKTIADLGGVIGINFCPDFLNHSGNADILDIIRHIEYISALAGMGCVGFGADLDGIDSLPAGISGVQDLGKIIEKLLQLNYSEEDVKNIAGGNFIRFMDQVLK